MTVVGFSGSRLPGFPLLPDSVGRFCFLIFPCFWRITLCLFLICFSFLLNQITPSPHGRVLSSAVVGVIPIILGCGRLCFAPSFWLVQRSGSVVFLSTLFFFNAVVFRSPQISPLSDTIHVTSPSISRDTISHVHLILTPRPNRDSSTLGPLGTH